MKHPERLQAAKDAIDEVFGDTLVPRAKTVESLEELRELCDNLIETVKSDKTPETPAGAP